MAARIRWRGTTTARGYGAEHQRLRAYWKPIVEAGNATCHAAICLAPTRAIAPGSNWHLGHLPDRSGWTGPEHATCNTSDGARRGNQKRSNQPAASPAVTAAEPLRTSRDW